LSAESKLSLLPFDLHVLGLPPTFNLSHDQTLHFKVNAGLPLLDIDGPLKDFRRPHEWLA
jgi:hypothetical protein